MRALVRTTKSCQYIHLGQRVPHNRPAVITADPWWQERIAAGDIEVLLGNLPDAATEAEWLLHWKPEDMKQSVEDFDLAVKALSTPPEEPPAPAKVAAPIAAKVKTKA